MRLGVCGIPKYGSESEFQKPNRTEPNYFSNSEKVGIPKKVGIPTFFGISNFALQDAHSRAIRAHTNYVVLPDFAPCSRSRMITH